MATGETIVEIDPRYFRPTEVDQLVGDSSKAHAKLGWRPQISVRELVREMVREDLKRIMETERAPNEALDAGL